MRVAILRKEHFNAAHRLYNPAWSDEENDVVFGKCNNPNWHGHNYEFIVRLTGEIDPETGFVYDMKQLSDLMQEFKSLNPTAENIVVVIYNILRAQIDPRLDMKVTLYETERNFVEYPA